MQRRRYTPGALLALAILITIASPATSVAERPDASGVAAHAPPWLGFRASPSKTSPGLVVKHVMRSSPASRAGLAVGDRITRAADAPLRSRRDLRALARSHSPGDALALVVARGEEELSLTLELAPRPTQAELLSTQLMGYPAPPAVLERAGGESLALDELAGKPVVIEFWATWCAGCKLLSPHLDALARDYEGAAHVVAITSQDAATIAPYLKKNPTSYEVLVDPKGRMQDAYYIQQLPIVLVLGPDGRVRKAYTGLEHPEAIASGVRAALDSLLERE